MSTDMIPEAIYRSRLVWTLTGDRLHLAHPVRYTQTLCGCRSEGPPAYPKAALAAYQVCARCRAAYDRELSDG